ncbi:4-hydroxyphenylacetate 3-monooxygenase, oxygenase component [Halobacillus salinarum]|uniref:4-hydroxyphenylacetate 3-monooxygenase, oxygenase component n=1 Tax=Halobacillus salinarum TaxID=2932257 RepID=A0ABY4ENG0_9BACI|nr:4-hydroxyphenylacetate 3-monooxygenase, oxygenase component [Halobacillus salinarum]UOQ45997.1 4-hydroxyphenylacetate 3-monooxygenase, oxygenase component [Halobacillus salinarum]
MAAITGEEYKRRINALHTDIWVSGEKVDGRISEHPAFKGVMNSQAELYDLQHSNDFMTFECELTKTKIGTSFLIPKCKEELILRRKMIQSWARHTGGLMGRSPDYMNTVLAAFAASTEILKGKPNCFPDRLEKFYYDAREKDLSFTHTFVNPQNNRAKYSFFKEDVTNARIVKRIEEGIVIKGAKLLATQGGITDEIIVFSAPGVTDNEFAYAFSIPSDTPGLKFICREPFSKESSHYNAPLSSRFEELDAVVVFNDVLVPWERVFFYDNIRVANEFYAKSKFIPFTLHQIVSRQVVKAELVLGIAQLIVDTINIGEYQHVQGKVTEIIKGLESLKALLIISEQEAVIDDKGICIPSRAPLYIAVHTFQEIYPRFMEILQLLGASGIVTIPTEKDFNSSIKEDLNHYLQAGDKKGEEKVRLFRLAWDLCLSSFGGRQTLYERFFFGDPIRVSQSIYNAYDKSTSIQQAEQFIKAES